MICDKNRLSVFLEVYGDFFSLFTFPFSLHRGKMVDKERLTFDQRVKTVLFLMIQMCGAYTKTVS